MNKLSAIISQMFRRNGGFSTTQMRMGSETGQVQGLRFIKNIPFFGSKPFKEQYRILLYLLVPASLATVGAVVYGSVQNNYAAQRIEKATQLQMLSQRSARLASQLSNGDASAAPLLTDAVEQIKSNIDALLNGTSNLSASQGQALTKLAKYTSAWEQDEQRAQRLLGRTDALVSVKEQNDFFADASRSALGVIEKIRIVQIDAGASQSVTSLTSALSAALIEIQQITPVSCTHLTLPTICSVEV